VERRLTLELLQWVERRPRTYAEAIEAWRSNCPRHPAWDDAMTSGLIRTAYHDGAAPTVELTATGRALLESRPA
jgi:hypothetical protein